MTKDSHTHGGWIPTHSALVMAGDDAFFVVRFICAKQDCEVELVEAKAALDV